MIPVFTFKNGYWLREISWVCSDDWNKLAGNIFVFSTNDKDN